MSREAAPVSLVPLAGFANDGGAAGETLETIGTLFPLAVDAGGRQLTVEPIAAAAVSPPLLPLPARAWADHDYGAGEGRRQERDASERPRIEALRYYDVARDYQPSVQRPVGRAAAGAPQTIEFPGAFAADDARALADAAARRGMWRRETLQWRVAELDPALAPGSTVRVPGRPGTWRIESWEWRERGVELELARCEPGVASASPGDAGAVQPPRDLPLGPTTLSAFELPAAEGEILSGHAFAAAGGDAGWTGAALFLDQAGELVPIGRTGRDGATVARLAAPLAPSPGLLFEPDATVELELVCGPGGLPSTSLVGVLGGANRLLVGGEVVQFARAEETEPGRWRLRGLLRGRGGTEGAALAGHPLGSDGVLIDDALTALDLAPALKAPSIAAIGLGDDEPVYAVVANPGLGRRPLCPVHPRMSAGGAGGLALSWVRRARGAWAWADGIEVPLGEKGELYRIGAGAPDNPVAEWSSPVPAFDLPASSVAELAAAHPGVPLWVRQVARFAQSDPLLLGHLA